ncbi:unnamed protein product [Closterium sp. Naga37s-1]|nr:unnamed protein product [Closterium sp. Naga37s-1]
MRLSVCMLVALRQYSSAVTSHRTLSDKYLLTSSSCTIPPAPASWLADRRAASRRQLGRNCASSSSSASSPSSSSATGASGVGRGASSDGTVLYGRGERGTAFGAAPAHGWACAHTAVLLPATCGLPSLSVTAFTLAPAQGQLRALLHRLDSRTTTCGPASGSSGLHQAHPAYRKRGQA